MSVKVNFERDDVFAYVEVKEDGSRVTYFAIENEYAAPIVRALAGLECRIETEPLFDPPFCCYEPGPCTRAGHCKHDCSYGDE